MMSERFNLVDYIFSNAKRSGRWRDTALILAENGERFSYSELKDYSEKIRGALQSLGIKAGDCVAIVMRDMPEWVASFFAITGMASVAVHTSTLLSAVDLGYVLIHSGARTAIITEDQAEKLAGIMSDLPDLKNVLVVRTPGWTGDSNADYGFTDFTDLVNRSQAAPLAETEDETLAFLAYTSGSTGKPKGVMHYHRNVRAAIETYGRHILNVKPEDIHFASSRLFFTYGIGGSLLFPLSAGATTVLSATPPRPDTMAKIFAEYRPTTFFGVPSVYRGLLEHHRQGNQLDTSSLKYGVTAGEAMPATLYREWHELTGVEVLDGIGSTEMLHTFIANNRGDVHPGSSGRLVSGYEAKLVGEDGHEIIGTGTGNLFVRGESQSPGYWRDAEKTSETVINGWMRTGDVYRRDENDVYWFEGRSDDMFKSKGTWISPGEVEGVLLGHPAVTEAAVVVGSDADGLGIVVAYVACRDSVDETQLESELRSHVRQRLPKYKCPSIIRFIEEMPRTATGKVQRFKLRQMEQGERKLQG